MTQRLFLTIGSRHSRDRVLLEVPIDEPIPSFLPDLAQVLGWKEFQDVPPSALGLETEDGTPLSGQKTLQDFGLTSSDLLFLISRQDSKIASSKTKKPSEDTIETGDSLIQNSVESAKLNQIFSQPHFQTPAGVILQIGDPPLTIGRAGKGYTPNIDLTEWDTKIIASRKHAILEKNGSDFVLKAQHTTNGTFINGVELAEGESQMLQDGDRVQFGFQGLEVTFRTPSSIKAS